MERYQMCHALPRCLHMRHLVAKATTFHHQTLWKEKKATTVQNEKKKPKQIVQTLGKNQTEMSALSIHVEHVEYSLLE